MIYYYWKILLDKIIAVIGIIFCAILLWWWIIIINLFMYRKPFFVQKRVGQYNKIFKLYKFRTLPINTPKYQSQEECQSKPNAFGWFLRRFRLDETLQFINILRGNMSLIGPRPCLENQYELLQLRKEYHVHFLRPGITGYAQIHGTLSDQTKALYDKDYLERISFKTDLYIFFKTFSTVIKIKDLE